MMREERKEKNLLEELLPWSGVIYLLFNMARDVQWDSWIEKGDFKFGSQLGNLNSFLNLWAKKVWQFSSVFIRRD